LAGLAAVISQALFKLTDPFRFHWFIVRLSPRWHLLAARLLALQLPVAKADKLRACSLEYMTFLFSPEKISDISYYVASKDAKSRPDDPQYALDINNTVYIALLTDSTPQTYSHLWLV
jgi:hypothetical protein